ncbi:MAG: hypothetical protein WKF48_12015 [Solirubrobacteraceae bacterium]
MSRLRTDESGAALITALMCTLIMLALGMALLSIVDTQASESASERTRDRGFNLSESVLNSQAFVLGRNWPANPATALSGAAGCSLPASGFGTMVGGGIPTVGTPAAIAAVERLRPNINASYTDAAYAGASWQINVCDDFDGTTVWTDTVLNNVGYDDNDNDKLWVRAQSTVDGRTRALVGLVNVRELPALKSRFGLVAGNVSEDVSSATLAITNAAVLGPLRNGLLDNNPPVAADPDHAVPASGVTGLRCGLLENVAQVKTCITGAIGALSQVPLINTLVTNGKYEQFPTTTSMSAAAIGQLRAQAKSSGQYIASTTTTATDCGITAPSNPDTVVFIEKVGDGTQACVLSVGTSKTYKAVVIGSGRIIIRGNNTITSYDGSPNTNRLSAVVYGLNLQNNHAVATPTAEIVRIDEGARVTGAVHADGKNATVALVAPDFSTTALVNALIPCTDLVTCTLRTTLKALGVTQLVNTLTSGECLATVLFVCVVPGPSVASVLGNITSQLTAYGSPIHSDVDVVKALEVYGVSGITPGTFRDLMMFR